MSPVTQVTARPVRPNTVSIKSPASSAPTNITIITPIGTHATSKDKMQRDYLLFRGSKESSPSESGLVMSSKGLIGIRSKRLLHSSISWGVSLMFRGSGASWLKSYSINSRGSIRVRCRARGGADSRIRKSQPSHPLIIEMIWGSSITTRAWTKHHLEHPEKYSTKWSAQLRSVTNHSSLVSPVPENTERVNTPTGRSEAVTFDSINTQCQVDDISTVSETNR